MKYKIYAFILIIIVILVSPAFSCRVLHMGGSPNYSSNSTVWTSLINYGWADCNPNMYPLEFGEGVTSVFVFNTNEAAPTLPDTSVFSIFSVYQGLVSPIQTRQQNNLYYNKTNMFRCYGLAESVKEISTPTSIPSSVYDGGWYSVVTVQYKSGGTSYIKWYLDGTYMETTTMPNDLDYTETPGDVAIYYLIGRRMECKLALHSVFSGVPSDNEIKTFGVSRNIYTFLSYNPFVFSTYDQVTHNYSDGDTYSNPKLAESISDIGDFGTGLVIKYPSSTGVDVIREDPGVRFTKKRKK